MTQKTYGGLFCLAVIVVYLILGWLAYIYILRPFAKSALHFFAPPTIEQHVNSNQSKLHK